MHRVRTLLLLAPLAGCPAGDDDDSDDTDVEDTDTLPDTDTDDTDATDTDTDPVETDTDTDTEPPTDPCLDETTGIEVGRFVTAYEPLAEGATVEMVHGIQGGWHLPIAVALEGIPQRVWVTLEATLDGGVSATSGVPSVYQLLLTTPDLSPWACEATTRELPLILGLAADTATPDPWEAFCGAEATVEVVVTTWEEEELGRTTLDIVMQPDPSDGPHCTD